MRNQCDHEQHQEDDEQQLCDSGGSRRDASEPENPGDNRDKQEYQCPVEHIASLLLTKSYYLKGA